MLLSDKVCIITGAASARGIGRATARLFVKHGAFVVILDLEEAQAKAAAADLGGRHLGLSCDVTDKQACLKAAERVTGEFGRIDVLINNAGITQPLKLMDIQPENYDAVLDVNLRGTLYMSSGCRAANAQAGLGLDRLHVVSLRPARRRHFWRAANPP